MRLIKQPPCSVSFVVTALNEEVNIEGTITEIYASIKGMVDDYEIILVNDGSTDQTGPLMEKLAAADPKIRVFHNEKNLNLGGAFKRGLKEVRLEHVMWLPGDNAVPAKNVRIILSKVGEADIVVPYLLDPRNRPFLRRIVSRTYTILLNTLFGLSLRYYNGGVVHRRDLIQSIDITTDSFACFAEALIKLLRRGSSYVEVGYISTERTAAANASSAFRFKNMVKVISTIWYLYRTCVLGGGGPNKAVRPTISMSKEPLTAGETH